MKSSEILSEALKMSQSIQRKTCIKHVKLDERYKIVYTSIFQCKIVEIGPYSVLFPYKNSLFSVLTQR